MTLNTSDKKPMLLTALTAAALAICSVVSPVVAGERRLQPCQYNDGKWIQVRSIDNGDAFTLEWDDGPRMSYVRLTDANGRWNVTDTLGGRWDYTDYGNGGGFTLNNLSNGNTIKCLGTEQ